MKPISLFLEPYQQITLDQMRRHHSIPYLREKAAALLKIADGQSVKEVARNGLLRPHKEDTVRGWVRDYQRSGLGAMYQLPRRKRDFSP